MSNENNKQKKKREEMKLSRRDFIKASAAAAAVSMAGLPVKDIIADSVIQYTSAQCRFCGAGCTVMAGIKNGKMVAVKGDPDSRINFGRLCMKGYSLPHIMYGEDRLTKPMVRQADGTYKTVSWDAAKSSSSSAQIWPRTIPCFSGVS